MLLSSPVVGAILVVILAASTARYIYSRYFSRAALPRSLPWIGAEDDTCFSRARATLRSFWHTRELVFDGYEKVCCSQTCGTAVDGVAVLQERPPVCPPKYQHWTGSHNSYVTDAMAVEA